ncbi:branched-chain amino acid ABC transporter permease [Variovorax sp. WS11]|uniref:branched-chain amino acid ABC transporter permease n=1 Tax=Variovorax sp. WS11 TaxID=1105204 RepID=UPI000D0CC060|nr:branched-chain amino acid ABC transporter permease [Variovorax sp. WS11]NDZ17651.1 branched-chain amino acid ABC transporter permease [Variovorax sp. WS11]PSL79568.1 branched-chain amino acid ABC transporter permease [Variovorax sp. WS11]
MDLFLFTLLNGLQLSMLVYMLAVGLTLIFGLMNVLNLAHGAFYTLGAYAGYVVAKATGSFWLALLLAPLLPFTLGVLFQRLVLQPLSEKGRSAHLDLALLTFGLLFATAGTVEVVFGSDYYSLAIPPLLNGGVSLLGFTYPVYRLFVIGAGLACAVFVWALLERTLIGATVRAGVDDREMVSAMGVNIRWVFALVFGLGCGLAGLGGVIAAPILSIYSQMGVSILVLTFVVVVLGGLGNVRGSFYAAIVAGMLDTFVQTYWPDVQMFALYALLVVIMTFKPAGLFKKEMRQA